MDRLILPLLILIAVLVLLLVGCGDDGEPSNTGQIGGTQGGVKTYESQIRLSDGRIVTCVIARDSVEIVNGKGVGVGISCDWAHTR